MTAPVPPAQLSERDRHDRMAAVQLKTELAIHEALKSGLDLRSTLEAMLSQVAALCVVPMGPDALSRVFLVAAGSIKSAGIAHQMLRGGPPGAGSIIGEGKEPQA